MSRAEELGYTIFRCPECGAVGATDTSPRCDFCGWDAKKEQEDEDGESDEA